MGWSPGSDDGRPQDKKGWLNMSYYTMSNKELSQLIRKTLKEKYSGHAIADNKEKTVHITHYEGVQWTLAEFEKEKSDKYAYKPTYWISSAQDLAVAMWRFKNIGTIYA